MTLPTKLTLLRIVLTFFIMWLLFIPSWLAKAAALVGFLLAGLTDWADGYLARRWRQQTSLGALLDPIADKVLVLGIFLAFVQLRLVPSWIVLVIAFREFLVTGVRLVAASRQVVLAASSEGKHKLVSQLAAILVVMTALVIRDAAGPQALTPAAESLMRWIVLGSLWVAMGLTVISGASFFWRHREILRDAVAR